MDRDEIYEKLTEIFRDVFDDDSIEIDDDTTAADISGWYSLTHITLLATVEEEFDIKFGMKEVQGLANVGELVDLISRAL